MMEFFKNTNISMSLHNYERLKECQQAHKDLIADLKAIIKPTETEGKSLEITINKERLEKFLLKFTKDCAELKQIEHDQVVIIYK